MLVEQELPISGRLGLLKQAGTAATTVAELRVRQAEFEIRQDTRTAFTRLAAAQLRLEDQSKTLALLEKLAARLGERERAGDGLKFDRLRAEREVAELRAEHRIAETDLAAARTSLAALMGLTGAPPLIASNSVVTGTTVRPQSLPTLDLALTTARLQRADFLASDAEVRRLEFDRQAATHLGRPHPILGGGWKNTAGGGGSSSGYAFSAGLAIPLFNSGQAGVAATSSALAAARAEREALAVEIEQQVRGAHTQAASRLALVDEYQREAVEPSRELVRIAEIAYDEGELGILELLDAHRSLVNAELRAISVQGGSSPGDDSVRPSGRSGGLTMTRVDWRMMLSAALLSGCGRGEPAVAIEDELPTVATTLWTTKSELFAEHPVLVVGEPARFAIHLTDLATFKPLTTGTVRVHLEGPRPETFSANAPSRPGIFGVTVKPTTPGRYSLKIDVAGPLNDAFDLGQVEVFGTTELARGFKVEEPKEERIAFLKEQQWVLDFGTAVAERRAMRPSLVVPGEIRPRTGGETVVAAPVAGRLVSTSAAAIGSVVSANDVLAQILPQSAEPADRPSLELGYETRRHSSNWRTLNAPAPSG